MEAGLEPVRINCGRCGWGLKQGLCCHLELRVQDPAAGGIAGQEGLSAPTSLDKGSAPTAAKAKGLRWVPGALQWCVGVGFNAGSKAHDMCHIVLLLHPVYQVSLWSACQQCHVLVAVCLTRQGHGCLLLVVRVIAAGLSNVLNSYS